MARRGAWGSARKKGWNHREKRTYHRTVTRFRPWQRLGAFLLAFLGMALASCRPQDQPLRFSSALAPERFLAKAAATRDTSPAPRRILRAPPVRPADPRFAHAGPFSEGRAPVLVGLKWGYADSAGTVRIPAAFDWAGPFSEGRAAVAVAGVHRFIDTLGDSVGSLGFTDARPFSGGYAAVRFGDPDDGAWGFIDRQGKLAIPPLFAEVAAGFSEGLAVVAVGHESARRFGFIDTSGGFAMDSLFDAAGSFSGGVAPVRRGGTPGGRFGGEWSFVDRTGARALPGDWAWAGSFREGRALVKRREGGFAWIDAAGAVVELLPENHAPAARWQAGLVTYELPYAETAPAAVAAAIDSIVGK